MKLLLYCIKAKPYLFLYEEGYGEEIKLLYGTTNDKTLLKQLGVGNSLNGKIVAECDFEVESMENYFNKHSVEEFNKDCQLYLPEFISYITKGGHHVNDLFHYAKENGNIGYAIHIKNLHIFDEPRELSEFYNIQDCGGMLFTHILKEAPQNMMRVSVNRWLYGEYTPNDVNILISIKPEWLCKILNGEKTIEVRKKVLKGML